MKIIDVKEKKIERKQISKEWDNFRLRSIFGVALTGGVLALASLPLIFAFEAHVINVTATIENPECKEFDIRSRGFWKTHEELWILPQSVGPTYVDTKEKAKEILEYGGNDMAQKIARELLALKFNITYYGLGNAFVPRENTRIGDLAWEADQLLVRLNANPDSVTKEELEGMKGRVEKTNTAGRVAGCRPAEEDCPLDKKLRVTRVEAGGTVMVMTKVEGGENSDCKDIPPTDAEPE